MSKQSSFCVHSLNQSCLNPQNNLKAGVSGDKLAINQCGRWPYQFKWGAAVTDRAVIGPDNYVLTNERQDGNISTLSTTPLTILFLCEITRFHVVPPEGRHNKHPPKIVIIHQPRSDRREIQSKRAPVSVDHQAPNHT